MTLPSPDTPLYNHALPAIEQWLEDQGCEQDRMELHCWRVERPSWNAELVLDVDHVSVRYINADGGVQDVQRSFKYSLSRRDIEEAIFSGP